LSAATSRRLCLGIQAGPAAADTQATIEDGVLTLTMPKSEVTKPRRIEIAVNPN
jgi:HSP20 family molecular chaperone IbpA